MRRTLVAVLALLAAVGCGSGSDTDRADRPTPTTASTTVEGEEFRDPQGTYAMTVPPGWTRLSGSFVAEIEAWAVAEAVDGFTSNVNVITQDFDGATPEDYIRFTRSGGGGIAVDAAEAIALAPGRQGARVVMSQTSDGRKLRSLAVAVTRQGTAALATLTAPEADFDRLVPAVEPYLRTLHFL